MVLEKMQIFGILDFGILGRDRKNGMTTFKVPLKNIPPIRPFLKPVPSIMAIMESIMVNRKKSDSEQLFTPTQPLCNPLFSRNNQYVIQYNTEIEDSEPLNSFKYSIFRSGHQAFRNSTCKKKCSMFERL